MASSFKIQTVSPREILAAKAVESNGMASRGRGEGGYYDGEDEAGWGSYGDGGRGGGYDPLMEAFGSGFEERIRPSFAFARGGAGCGGTLSNGNIDAKMREDVEDAFF